MADNSFLWIYLLIFILLPLSRILPRVIKKWRMRNSDTSQQYSENSFQVTNDHLSESPREPFTSQPPRESKPQTKDMLVLGELNHGTKNFNSIQKNLGMDSKTLDAILEDLENQGLMRVEQKQGLFGTKLELLPTEKGFKKYYS